MLDSVLRRFALLALALLLTACGGGGVDVPIPSAQAQSAKPVIVAFGDSLTVCYLPDGGIVQLRADLCYLKELRELGPVYTYAAGGMTSDHGAGYQLHWMRHVRADAVVVLFGINDAIYEVSPAQAVANAKKMFEAFPDAKKRILISPPLWKEATRAGQEAIAEAYRAAAPTLGAIYIDAYTPSAQGQMWCHPEDHHPCAAWHRALGAQVIAALK